ncbi:MAG: site-specific integrase [Lewinellaceae bacterium]|nr:site-specific integrase [Lewinellaceae bacterium]
MVTTNIILDTRYKKKGNLFPLKLRVVLNRKFFDISLGFSIPAKDWDEKGQQIKSSKTVENVTRLNSIISKEKQKVVDVIIRLQDEGKLDTISLDELKSYATQKNTEAMTLAFAEEIIAELQEAKKFGNARVYDTMLRSIRDFVKSRDFPLKQLTYAWLKKYEAWYLSKGNSANGLSVSMRTLRALYNRAIKQKLVAQEYYPFSDYTIKNESTRKRAITAADLEQVKQFEPTTERQERAKDFFMLSFYLMGASFVDIAFLKVKNITGGRIEYKRRKTGRLHSVPISPPLQALLDKYMAGKGKEDFILNVIKSTDPKRQVANVRDELRRFNRSLKEIGVACGIEAPLTSYVARHSYATIAKYKGVPTAVISEALGHKTEDVTQVYLDSFDKEVLDKYHTMIIE